MTTTNSNAQTVNSNTAAGLMPAGFALVPVVLDGDKWAFIDPAGRQSAAYNTADRAQAAAHTEARRCRDARPTLEQAKKRYTNRYTLEHAPAWTQQPRDARAGVEYYAPQYATCAQWYESTTFPGELVHAGGSGHCSSTGATWPGGFWLQEPYNARGRSTVFSALSVGAWFRLNGNICRKQSTRTARLIDFGRVFYVKQGEPVAALL